MDCRTNHGHESSQPLTWSGSPFLEEWQKKGHSRDRGQDEGCMSPDINCDEHECIPRGCRLSSLHHLNSPINLSPLPSAFCPRHLTMSIAGCYLFHGHFDHGQSLRRVCAHGPDQTFCRERTKRAQISSTPKYVPLWAPSLTRWREVSVNPAPPHAYFSLSYSSNLCQGIMETNVRR